MSNSDQLREQRAGTVINSASKVQDALIRKSAFQVCNNLESLWELGVYYTSEIPLPEIAQAVKKYDPTILLSPDMQNDSWSIRPDSGCWYLKGKQGERFYILTAEMKHQGTNSRRLAEGLPPQAQGNAIERATKNLEAFRNRQLNENIVPFVLFGDGDDLEENSSIRGRLTSSMIYGRRENTTYLENKRDLKGGSIYIRKSPWTESEVMTIAENIAYNSIDYYINKYGQEFFRNVQEKQEEERQERDYARMLKLQGRKRLKPEEVIEKERLETQVLRGV